MMIEGRRGPRPRLCFVAQNAYGALARVDTGHIGGIERQTALTAQWFARQGYEVSAITWDEGQEDRMLVDKVRVFKMCRKDDGIPGLRFFHPKWTSLCGALQRADADVYYYNSGDGTLGQIAMWCRSHQRKCIYSVAANRVCMADHVAQYPLRERILYRHGLKHACVIVVQTRNQQEMLRQGFRVDSTVISMPCEGFASNACIPAAGRAGEDPHVLWVGRISEEKRFEWLLDVAERCPEITFDVVGASNVDSRYASTLAARAAGIPNVNMQGRVLHAKLVDYYGRSRALCCTSKYEGFPNTFLEAWSCGIPVVTTFDPDGIVATYRLGWVASEVSGLTTGLQTAMESPEAWQAASQAARSYYLQRHTLDVVMPQFEQLFLDVFHGQEGRH